MPLTPADVHNVVFKKPPIGKRGYDEDEVDAFLDVVEAELARLIEENNELRANRSRRKTSRIDDTIDQKRATFLARPGHRRAASNRRPRAAGGA